MISNPLPSRLPGKLKKKEKDWPNLGDRREDRSLPEEGFLSKDKSPVCFIASQSLQKDAINL
jgi:hypothetical protein